MAGRRRTKRVTAAEAKAQIDSALSAEFAAFEKSFAPRLEAALKEAETNGAAAERARIKAVFAQELPGHEKLIYFLAFETTASGPEAAVRVIAAERLKRAIAAQVERDLEEAVDRFTDELRAEDIARRAQDYVDRQFAVGITITFDAAIEHVMKTDAEQ